VPVCVTVGVIVIEDVHVGVAVHDDVPVCVPVWVIVCVPVCVLVPVRVPVPVCDGVKDGVEVGLGTKVPHSSGAVAVKE